MSPPHETSKSPPQESSDHFTLFVGNISDTVSEDQLRNFFSSYGNIVSLKFLEHKLIAFIIFENREQAEVAKTCQGISLGGKPLKIDWARSKEAPKGEHSKNQSGSYSGSSRGDKFRNTSRFNSSNEDETSQNDRKYQNPNDKNYSQNNNKEFKPQTPYDTLRRINSYQPPENNKLDYSTNSPKYTRESGQYEDDRNYYQGENMRDNSRDNMREYPPTDFSSNQSNRYSPNNDDRGQTNKDNQYSEQNPFEIYDPFTGTTQSSRKRPFEDDNNFVPQKKTKV